MHNCPESISKTFTINIYVRTFHDAAPAVLDEDIRTSQWETQQIRIQKIWSYDSKNNCYRTKNYEQLHRMSMAF